MQVSKTTRAHDFPVPLRHISKLKTLEYFMKIPAAELISKLFAETERKRTGSNGFTASLNINKGAEPNKILR